MENASKALIIAGAILLAILLISLGIFIFSQAQDTVNNSGMSQAEVTAFNNKFLKYEGIQKGSVVKSLLNDVAAINNDENNKSAGVSIQVTTDINEAQGFLVSVENDNSGKTKKCTVKSNFIKVTNSYKVEVLAWEKGRVYMIMVSQV